MNKQTSQFQVCFQNEPTYNILKAFLFIWLLFSKPQTTIQPSKLKAPASNDGFRTPNPMIPKKLVIHFWLCKNSVSPQN